MSLRQIYLSPLRRNLSVFMIDPSSSPDVDYEAGLQAFQRMGGNAIHLHGEGGEINSRQATGKWLRTYALRPFFFLCTQICHDDWDDAAQQSIVRFTPEALHQDIATDLELLGTDYLDMVYLDDRPDLPFEPLIEALRSEIALGRVHSFGVRNFTPERLQSAHAFAIKEMGQGIAAVITTELSLLIPNHPLWSDYVPFDNPLRQTIVELGMIVLAHAGDLTLGQSLFGEEEPLARLRPEWVQRWQNPSNRNLVSRIQEITSSHGKTPREIQMGWLLNQPYPVVAIVRLPTLQTQIGLQYEHGSHIGQEELERITEEISQGRERKLGFRSILGRGEE
jgi:1-deoxyxylulose-5-phosphate synthase